MLLPGRLRIVVFQTLPGFWTARALEHDLATEARDVRQAVRALCRLVDAHSAFDRRHHRAPLSAFFASPQIYWHAFRTGTPVPLASLDVTSPHDWRITVVMTHRPGYGAPVGRLTPLARTPGRTDPSRPRP